MRNAHADKVTLPSSLRDHLKFRDKSYLQHIPHSNSNNSGSNSGLGSGSGAHGTGKQHRRANSSLDMSPPGPTLGKSLSAADLPVYGSPGKSSLQHAQSSAERVRRLRDSSKLTSTLPALPGHGSSDL